MKNSYGRDSLSCPCPSFGGLECNTNQQQFVNFLVGNQSELQPMAASCQLTPSQIHFQLLQRQVDEIEQLQWFPSLLQIQNQNWHNGAVQWTTLAGGLGQ